MADNKPDKGLIATPVEYLCGNPKNTSPSSGADTNGVPEGAKRTAGASGPPEVTFDKASGKIEK